MEDQVAFKVFAYLGEDSKPEVRRFGIDKSVVTNYHYLNAKLHDVYPGLKRKSFTVTWKDDDGDDVSISSDEELMTALTSMYGQLIKLNIWVKPDAVKDDDVDIVIAAEVDAPPEFGACSSLHNGVLCDGCESPVVGFRYKCISCEDFDLCSKCEAQGLHSEHCMLRVPSPKLPRTLIKASIKRSRHFLKTVSDNDAHKRHRHDESNERRHHGDRHHGDRHHGDRHHGGQKDRKHSRPRGNTWLDTFATYMNEFADLSGDAGLNAQPTAAAEPRPQPATEQKTQPEQAKTTAESSQATKPQAESASSNQQNECPILPGMDMIQKLAGMFLNGQLATIVEQTQAKAKAEAQSQPQPGSTGTTSAPGTNSTANKNECPFLPGLEAVPQILEMVFNGQLSNIVQQQQAPSQSETTSEPQAQPQPESTSADNAAPENLDNGDVEMLQAPQEAGKVSIKSRSSASSSAGSVRDQSPDKGWTMINKEKDLAEDFDNAASAPADPTNIGFNLPQQFQRNVTITGSQSIYPPLNVATAVLDPKDVERRDNGVPTAEPTRQAGSQPTAQGEPKLRDPQPQPNQQTPPQQAHLKPHIDAALRQMLAMGFTNEGGWLTQLLESVNGNIAHVMDLLTPVKPK